MDSTPHSDETRPLGHIDAPDAIVQPKLDFKGYARFFWRQLTSMRTALFLLLLMAIAAIPGSLVPQMSSDPNGVIQYKAENPGLADVLDKLQVFNTYSSVWFSAIYLLLFVSLIGCVIPRTRHHLDALKAQPPKTPANLERLEAFTTRTAKTSASKAIASAEEMLRAQRYRTQVFGDSVSAERGYLRETGNLVFHSALIGMLVAVGLGSGFGYTGQRVVVEGYAFNNSLASYDSFNPGRFFDASSLAPYSIALDRFDATYEENNLKAYGQATDYTATVTSTLRGQQPQQQTIKVNSPLEIAGDQVYLLGNGYAPVITVRDPDGHTVYSQPVPFLPQDANLFSLGIIKVPDGLSKQIGMRGLLYPTALRLDSGTFASSHPALRDPLLTLEVFTGDLGLDNGKGTNAYALNTDSLTEIAGRKAKSPTIALRPGDRVDLPNGLGSVELTAIPRFVSLDVHHDPAQGWALVFAILIVSGLLTSLFVPRRRMWVRAVRSGRGTVILEYAALARGDDPGLDAAVQDFAERRSSQLGLKVGS